ncbi:MAG: ATP-binding cassette domain-containing protein [Clostridiales bacterium]|nr:ATP-binding cassette domain-containing protein [Clostridiales bacterium]
MLEIKNLCFNYQGEEKPALKNIDLKIDDGGFVVVYGKNGCSKTTLLRHLKPETAPNGVKTGEVFLNGKSIDEYSGIESSKTIAYVPQNTSTALVTHTVYKELAFSLECLGMSDKEIYLRIAECCEYFGIGRLFERSVSSLSGGEQKLVLIAAAVCLDPRVIILDEPLSQLDPISCKKIVNVLHRLNTEKGVTVIISEHKLEDVFSVCTRIIAMNNGEIICDGEPMTVANDIFEKNGITEGLPSYIRLYHMLGKRIDCPKSIAEARESLRKIDLKAPERLTEYQNKDSAIVCKGLNFKYGKNDKYVINDLSFELHQGEITALLGSNGSGKTTLIKILAGLIKPADGSVKYFGKSINKIRSSEFYGKTVAYLPQNPIYVFAHEKVSEDLDEIAACHKISKEQKDKFIQLFDIAHLINKNPRDLSAGELQKCALCAVMLTKPKVLLLDEPCKALDSKEKKNINKMLLSLRKQGISILIVTHDCETAADVCDTCAMLFNGEIVGIGDKYTFFSNNKFYTTPVRRMTDGITDNCISDIDIKRAGAACEK